MPNSPSTEPKSCHIIFCNLILLLTWNQPNIQTRTKKDSLSLAEGLEIESGKRFSTPLERDSVPLELVEKCWRKKWKTFCRQDELVILEEEKKFAFKSFYTSPSAIIKLSQVAGIQAMWRRGRLWHSTGLAGDWRVSQLGLFSLLPLEAEHMQCELAELVIVTGNKIIKKATHLIHISSACSRCRRISNGICRLLSLSGNFLYWSQFVDICRKTEREQKGKYGKYDECRS